MTRLPASIVALRARYLEELAQGAASRLAGSPAFAERLLASRPLPASRPASASPSLPEAAP